MAQPFIPVNGQAGLDQTANKRYVRNSGRRGTEKETKIYTQAHTHTLSQQLVFPAESMEGANDSRY